MKTEALLDSNVVIAMLVERHEHHASSLALLDRGGGRYGVGAHSYAEAYNVLTRQAGGAPYRLTPGEAWAALESVREVTDLVGLTPAQTLEALRDYAASGGVGARLYDRLIGEVAVVHGIATIVTWNVSHMCGLFPDLAVVTPEQVVSAR